ncbi:hypothetical protein [Micromonospora sp. AMSO12t]|uniref:hypothetical protein n=1 Tax=Micromonospora sp. AMSO12t TaxID=2650410 RepID=UPI001788E5C9|nr:hypothetical protein [Micromonospora sp. AMSO12t]
MTATDPLLASVPEQFYVHNPDRGETLHRSATEAIQRDVTALLRFPPGMWTPGYAAT